MGAGMTFSTHDGVQLFLRSMAAINMSDAIDSIDVFLDENAININQARMQHLASMGLDIAGKTVLEVGAGVGLLTTFFEERGCTVLTTEGRSENVEEMRNRYPHRRIELLDLDETPDFSYLGQFDIVFCYGTLYHLSRPEQVLKAMAQVCSGMLLLETCVSPGDDLSVNLVEEKAANPNQAKSGTGCRPTRPWIMQRLKENCGFAYVSKYQPCHVDFDFRWDQPLDKKNHRSIFVGSKQEIYNDQLLTELPPSQEYCAAFRQEWLEFLLTQWALFEQAKVSLENTENALRNEQFANQDLRSLVDGLQASMAELESRCRNLTEDFERERLHYQLARERLVAMETSKFWKLRRRWMKLRHRLGLKADL